MPFVHRRPRHSSERFRTALLAALGLAALLSQSVATVRAADQASPPPPQVNPPGGCYSQVSRDPTGAAASCVSAACASAATLPVPPALLSLACSPSIASSSVGQEVAAYGAPPGYDVSDNYAKAFVVAQHAAPELIQHMTTRITSYIQPPSVRFAESSSSNWGGYVQNGPSAGIEQVQGRFSVTSEPSGADQMASWLGIGGWNGQNLIQTGVDDNNHMTWVEMLPQSPVYLFGVNDGDYLYGLISYDHGTGKWYVEIDDETTGNYWVNEYSYSPDQTSAEWIVEDAGGTQAVPNQCCYYFWASEFTDGSDNTNSPQAMNSPSGTLTRVVLNYPYGGHLYPSGVGSDGETFDVTQG
jgi:hypothetical protein